MKIHWMELFKGMGIAIMFFFIIGSIIVGPLLTIWAINTLFGFGIAYTLKTWFATLIMHSVLGGTSRATQAFKDAQGKG